jgi:hypothetical protein
MDARNLKRVVAGERASRPAQNDGAPPDSSTNAPMAGTIGHDTGGENGRTTTRQ